MLKYLKIKKCIKMSDKILRKAKGIYASLSNDDNNNNKNDNNTITCVCYLDVFQTKRF